MPQTSLHTWFKPARPPAHAAVAEPADALALAPVTARVKRQLHAPAAPPTPTATADDTPSTTTTATATALLSASLPPLSAAAAPAIPPALPPPTLPLLPPHIHVRPLAPADIPPLRRLNALLLPIPYPPHFYAETLAEPAVAALTLGAFYLPAGPGTAETLVGAIRCRLIQPDPGPDASADADTDADRAPTLYISTLALLSAHRGKGIAAYLLEAVAARAAAPPPPPPPPGGGAGGAAGYGCAAVAAHVWEANEEARAWYVARGFEEVARLEGYYRRLRPQGAVCVRRRIGRGMSEEGGGRIPNS